MLLGKAFSFLSANLSASVEVAFVSDQHYGHVRVTILSDFFEPPGKMSERVTSGDIVNQKGSSCAAVVASCNALERLLTCCVPNLELNVLVVYLNSSCTELDSNRQIVLLSEAFVSKLEEKTGLADT